MVWHSTNTLCQINNVTLWQARLVLGWVTAYQGSKNPDFFLKAQPSGFYWVLLVFLDKQENIGKIIQKLSNLKL